MKAVVYTQGTGFHVEDIPRPGIGPEDLLLKVRATAICGTDMKILANGHGKLESGRRVVLGHEFVGDIIEVGSHVQSFRTGQRIGVVPNIGCNRCPACLRGKANYCPDYKALGINQDGAHAEYLRIPASFLQQGNVMVMPDSVGDIEAALLEPFSCVINGIRSTRVELGDIAVIYGAGPIGLMHLMLLRICGTAKILVVDVLDQRLECAAGLGADCTVNGARTDVHAAVMEISGGQGADIVITACAAPAVQEEAVRILAPFGRLCLFGSLPKNSGTVHLDSNAVHYRNNLLTGTTGGSPEDFRIGLRLVEHNRIDLTRVVSDMLPLSKFQQAYETAQSGPLGKVVLLADDIFKGTP